MAKRHIPSAKVPLMLMVNAFGLGKGDSEIETNKEHSGSWMHAFLSMLTGFVCAMLGLLFLMQTMQRRRVNQHIAAEERQADLDPAVKQEDEPEPEGHRLRRLRHLDTDEMDEPAEPAGNLSLSGDLARLLRQYGVPEPYERLSPEHMLLWLIIRGQGRMARSEGDRFNLWRLKVNSLIQLLQRVRTCTDPTVRQQTMTALLDAGDFSSDDDSPFHRQNPDHRQAYINEVHYARDFADHVINSFQSAGPVDAVMEAEDYEAMEEESPTSDVSMEDNMQTYRLNRQAAIEMGNMEEAAYWESMESHE